MFGRHLAGALLCLLFLATGSVWSADDEKPEPGLNAATFKGLELRNIGPAFTPRMASISARMTGCR